MGKYLKGLQANQTRARVNADTHLQNEPLQARKNEFWNEELACHDLKMKIEGQKHGRSVLSRQSCMAADLDELARTLRALLRKKGGIASTRAEEAASADGARSTETDSARGQSVQKAVKEMFCELDASSNGLINRAEFAAAIQKLGMELSQTEIDQLIKRFSKGDEQTISSSEFVAFVVGSDWQEHGHRAANGGNRLAKTEEVVCAERVLVPKRRPLSAQYAGFHRRPQGVVPRPALSALVEAHAP